MEKLFVLLLLVLAVLANAQTNYLIGGDFEGAEARDAWGGTELVQLVGPMGEQTTGLRSQTATITWAMAGQSLRLPTGAASLRLAGWARGEALTPSEEEPYYRAQLQVGFFGGGGEQLGNWESANLPSGDSDWTFYEGQWPVPEGVWRAQIYLGNNHVTGTSWFDNIVVEVLDESGAALQPVTEQHTDVTGWYPLASPDVSPDAGSPLDLSWLNKTPAGSHGFLTAKGDSFVFEDGTPVKFWGTNCVAGAAFPDHELAEQVAGMIARSGFNLVRFHHMDADWASPNIFDVAGGTYDKPTRQLSAESLDRLDYFVDQLKQHGIYVMLDLLVHRRFNQEDLAGQPDPDRGAKEAAMFDPLLWDLQCEYATQLLTHKNPYTGNRYVDEPALVLSECINESSLFYLWGLTSMKQDRPWYYEQLQSRLADWCGVKGHEVPAGDLADLLRSGDAVVLEFLYETQTAYFQRLREFLRGLGYRVPITGSNHWERHVGDLRSNATLDWIDTHNYWDHPQGGYSPTNNFGNSSTLKGRGTNLASYLAIMQVVGKPLTISEWNCVWPNEYIIEGPLLMALAGAIQGWDGPMQFSWGGYSASLDHMDGCFENWNKSHFMAANWAAALLFRRGDIKPADWGWVEPLSADPAAYFEAPLAALPEGEYLRSAIGNSLDGLKFAKNGEANGEVKHDPDRGLLVVDTASSQGAVGFLEGQLTETSLLAIEVEETPFCQVFLSSLDSKPLADSQRMALTVVARAENTNQVWKPFRNGLKELGTGPVLMEPVRATVTLKGARSLTVTALDQHGNPTGRTLPVDVTTLGATFQLGEGQAFWYLLER